MKTATLTQEQALDALEEMGAHKIVAEDWANEIGAPFDVTFKEVEFTHEPEDFKGPRENRMHWTESHRVERARPYWEPYQTDAPLLWKPLSCMGVDIHYIADTIRWSVGIKPPRFTGLGSQFRTDIEAVRKVLAKAS